MDRVRRSAWPVPCGVVNTEPCDLAKAGRADECEAESRQSPLACRKRAKRELRFRARNPAKPLRCAELVSGLPIFGPGNLSYDADERICIKPLVGAGLS